MNATNRVTGATGYIGAHLVERLLAQGHGVRGTVRNGESSNATALQELPHAAERLELVHADLLSGGS
ncbi:MAG: GDP-mannose 4,6-dehydratase [Acidimicrobiia bacterium]